MEKIYFLGETTMVEFATEVANYVNKNVGNELNGFFLDNYEWHCLSKTINPNALAFALDRMGVIDYNAGDCSFKVIKSVSQEELFDVLNNTIVTLVSFVECEGEWDMTYIKGYWFKTLNSSIITAERKEEEYTKTIGVSISTNSLRSFNGKIRYEYKHFIEREEIELYD